MVTIIKLHCKNIGLLSKSLFVIWKHYINCYTNYYCSAVQNEITVNSNQP